MLASFEEREGYTGCVGLVELEGEQAFHESFEPPLAIVASKRLGTDAIYPIFSMTKAIVSIATLQLVEEGTLSLDDPIALYLPEFERMQVCEFNEDGSLRGRRAAQRAITLADLLGHTSGLSYGLFEQGPIKEIYERADLDREFGSNRELSRALAALPLAFEPGSEWRYGRSTDVLGALLEEVEGQRLSDVLQQRLLGPLGMTDTAFFVAKSKVKRVAEGMIWFEHHWGTRTPRIWAPLEVPSQEPAACNAGSGLYSTCSDYLRFCQMLLAGGKFDGRRYLSAEMLKRFRTDRIEGLPRPRMLRSRGFGLGVAVLTEESAGPENGTVGAFHWSGYGGTSFFVDPELELIGVFMTHKLGDFSFMVDFRKAVYRCLKDEEPLRELREAAVAR